MMMTTGAMALVDGSDDESDAVDDDDRGGRGRDAAMDLLRWTWQARCRVCCARALRTKKKVGQ